MAIKREYRESRDFNPVLSTVKKHTFALQRYIINLLLLAIAVALFYVSQAQTNHYGLVLGVAAALFFAASLSARIAFEWERVPLLRFGCFRKTKGPGLFFVIPFVDVPCGYIDCRISVTDFSAEKVLTKDAVPIFFDAIIFWMIWDAAKAKLEVENFSAAVPLSAKTALRDIIGKTTLAELLTNRDEIGQELQKILDAKTNPWGITSLSVEIKDIVVPQELEDAISREAQAERERSARVILGSAEIELAEKYSKAAEKYKGNEEAMTLRSLNLLLDSVKNKGSMILVPSEVPHLMNKAVAAAMAKNGNRIEEDSLEV
ncbi:slipin family protein [Chitinispirillales bacterium ANBcel5]|uniref:slipin family protein n=1 Tax=Cellulosispirillum alkaliphilum TaxID=3039283 RepID=UPI002A51CEE2|nr:slipin family protein [Chitinispirillales bacterium ANBcel5]